MNVPALRIREVPEGCTLGVRVHPGARANSITGVHDGALKVSLTAPASDGRANEALLAFVATRLSLPRSQIELAAGVSSRNKVLRIRGRSAADTEAALRSSLA